MVCACSYPLFVPVMGSIGIRTVVQPLKAFFKDSSLVPYHRFFTNSVEVGELFPLVTMSPDDTKIQRVSNLTF